MFKRTIPIALVALCLLAPTRVSAGNDPIEKAIDVQLKKLALAPSAVDAELRIIAIFQLWDLLGPERVMAALKEAKTIPGLSIRAIQRIEHINAQASLRTGKPQVADASYKKRGFIHNWLVSKSFDNEGGTGLQYPFAPEQQDGRENSKWRVMPAQIFAFGYNHLEALYSPSKDTCAYAVTTFTSSKEGKAVLRVGAGGAHRTFFNGDLASQDHVYRGPDPDRQGASIQVNKGPNRLMVKVCSEKAGHLGFYARITDKSANPWPVEFAGDQISSLAAKVKSRGPSKKIKGPIEQLCEQAKKSSQSAVHLFAAAHYLHATNSEDETSLYARDLAKNACEKSPTANRCLLWSQLSMDKNEQRLAIRRALDSNPDSIDAIIAVAQLQLQSPEPFRAANLLGSIKNKKIARAQAILTRLEKKQGFRLLAFIHSMELLRANPDIPMLTKLALEHSISAGTLKNLLKLTNEITKVHFENVSAHETLAKLALARGDTKVLNEQMAALDAIEPFSDHVHEFCAGILEGAKLLKRAEQKHRLRVELSPNNAEAWKQLGLFLTRTQRNDEGVRALARAADIRPQDTWLADYMEQLRPGDRFQKKHVISSDEFLKWNHNPDVAFVYLVDQTVARVYDSGLGSRFTQTVVQINNREAAKLWRTHWISFSPNSQRIKVLAARLFHKNGEVEEIPVAGIVPISEPWYRLYYDVEAAVLEMPPLVPGDVLEFRYRIDDTSLDNEFGDYFGDLIKVAQQDAPKVLWRYTLVAPKNRRFYFDKPRMVSHKSSVDGDLKTQTFEAHDVVSAATEQGMPRLGSTTYLHVSTYGSWQKLGDWYRGLIRHQMVADSRINNKAKELTKGLTDERKKVDAIYNWVVTATRYVGLEFGIHGYKPYRAPLVVSRGFGDCKDKASLLVTMLKEVGIEADFVLLRTRHAGDLGGKIASLSAFDHAIAYVPSLDLWLDGTAEHHGAGEFPFPDQGVHALRLGREKTISVRTPVLDSISNSSTQSLRILLDPDGDIQLNGNLSVVGATAALLRTQLESPGTRRERFAAMLAQKFTGVRLGELQFTSIDDLSKPVEYTYTAFIPGYAQSDEDLLSLPIDEGLELSKRYARMSTRHSPLLLGATTQISRTISVLIPAGFEVLKLPATFYIDNQFGRFSLSVIETGGTVLIERKFELSVHQVSAADYPDFSQFCNEIDEALNSRVVFRRLP